MASSPGIAVTSLEFDLRPEAVPLLSLRKLGKIQAESAAPTALSKM